MVKLHSWTLRFVCGFSTWQNCRYWQWRPSKVVPVPGAGFPCGLSRAGSCAGCRAQMGAQGGSKPNLGLLQPQPGLSFGLWQQSQLCSEERHCSSWAACGSSCWIQEKWVVWGSHGLVWFPVKSPALVFPGGSALQKPSGWAMEGNPWGKQQVTTQILLWSSFLYMKYYQNKIKACVITDILCQILPGHEGMWIKTQ